MSNLLALGMGLDFAGGILGSRSARKSAKNQAAIQSYWMEKQLAQQERFAKEGIRWRVEDAKAAGLHPLYAIGATGASYSPQSFIPGQAETGSHAGSALQSAGKALQNYHHNKARLDLEKDKLDIQRKRMENLAIRSEIDALNRIPSLNRSGKSGASQTPAASVAAVEEFTKRNPPTTEVVPSKIEGPGFYVRDDGTVGRFNTPESAEDLRWIEHLYNEAARMYQAITGRNIYDDVITDTGRLPGVDYSPLTNERVIRKPARAPRRSRGIPNPNPMGRRRRGDHHPRY